MKGTKTKSTRPGCATAALFLAAMAQTTDAAAIPITAQETSLHRIAAVPMATRGLYGQDTFAQRVVWVSLIRRLIVRLRAQALPAGAAAALEEAAKALAKGFPREKVHQELCFGLDSLVGRVAIANGIKPDARAALLELVKELKQVAGCRSPRAAQR